MTTYQIKIFYCTGDSFGSEDTEQLLELEWTNLDVAKENLRRIRDHYDYHQSKTDRYKISLAKAIEATNPPWFVPKYPDYTIKLIADNGNDWQLHTFWTGYFEHLYGAEIVIKDDPELSFTTV